MRVFVLGRALPANNSSVGQFEFEQALALSKQEGVTVAYFFFDDRSIMYNRRISWTRERREGIDCIGCSLPIGGLPWKAFSAIKTRFLEHVFDEAVMACGRPDVVHAHFPAICMTSVFAAKLKEEGIPLVCTEHWTRVQNDTLDSNRRNSLIEIAKECSSFICVSEDLRDSVQRITGIDSGKLHVVPNLVPESIFQIRTGYSNWVDNDSTIRYFSAGRLEGEKRFDILLDAFSKLPRNRQRSLVIAGEGSKARSLKKLAERLNIDDLVSFVGWQERDAIAQLYAKANCYISPSPNETFGVPFAEAWMCGIPCIGADNNPLRGLFNEKWGRMFSANDPSSLAQCVLSFESECPDYTPQEVSAWANGLFSSKVVGETIDEILSKSCIVEH